jgi:methylmalonyl-CoA decarboxylase
MDAAQVLARAEDRVAGGAAAAFAEFDQAARRSSAPDEPRLVQQLAQIMLRCVHEGRVTPVIKPSEQVAAHCFAAGAGLDEVQAEFTVLSRVLWRHIAGSRSGEQLIAGLELVHAVTDAGKDALARTYVALASLDGERLSARPAPPQGPAAGAPGGPDGPADVVQATMAGRVGIITLADQRKRNAIGDRVAAGIAGAVGSLHAQGARAIVLRAAPGMTVWSAGHDIDELPKGRRDPLGYDDPLEEMLRAVRTCPAPVIAMVHGTVWGGAVELVLSCDLVVADETATFAVTPVNLGLPYNVTGLLHFLGRLPCNLIKEMFFTAAPVDARKAKEWQIVNHLIAGERLEEFTLELAAAMATKSPLAIAAIKEQLRVLSDYHPIAAQVYERVQALRRQAYDSQDYLEGLSAFAEKRQPIFGGA